MTRFLLSIVGGALLSLALGLSGCTSAPEANRSAEVVAEGAAWTWFTDERAIVADSTLYVGHVDTAGAVGVTTHPLGPLREDPRYEELIREVNQTWGLNPDGSIPEEVDVSFDAEADA